MALYLTFRTISRLAFLFVATFAGFIGSIVEGVQSVNGNPGIVFGGKPVLLITFFTLVAADFIWEERERIFSKSKPLGLVIFLVASAILEFSLSFLAIAAGGFLAYLSSFRIVSDTNFFGLAAFFGVGFFMVDLPSGCALYALRARANRSFLKNKPLG
jgi:hypothetical protein